MKLKYGMIVTDGAGKLGGNVISKNHYGRFARQYVVPTDPHSADQTARRVSFGTFATKWKTLTALQQSTWIAAAINYPRVNNIGNTYYPTGQTLYIEINTNLNSCGIAPLTSAPVKVIPPTTGGFTVSCLNGSGGLKLTFTTPATIATAIYFIRVTEPLSPGINYVSTKLRSIYSYSMVSQASLSIGASYITKYGVPAIGQKIFVEVFGIDKTSGSQSIHEFGNCLVAP